MTKQFLLNIPAKDWHIIEAATSGQPTKTKWMVKVLREAALKAIPDDLVDTDEDGDVAALDAALAYSKQVLRPAPVVKEPPDPKPWLKDGAFAWPQQQLDKYGMEAMLEWVEKVAKPKWYEYDNPVFPHQLDCILKGIPYVRPKFVRDPITGRMRVATAEETAELLAKENPPVVPQSDEWA